MADTVRSLTALQALLADNTARAISPQDIRDALYSVLGVVPFVAKTSSYTATANDEVIPCDATGGAITITLPAVASTRVGKVYTIKKLDNSNNVIIDGNSSEQVEFGDNITLTTQYESVTIINTGSAWLAVGNYTP